MDTGNRNWLIPLIVVLLAVLLVPALGWGMMGWGMMGPGMMGGWWGWAGANPWWGALMLIFWVLIIAGVVLLVVWAFRQAGPAQRVSRRSLEILQERYARGELTREQYEQMRRDLE